jgi:hypothetical protein
MADDLGATILLTTALAAVAFLALLVLRCAVELLVRLWRTRADRRLSTLKADRAILPRYINTRFPFK